MFQHNNNKTMTLLSVVDIYNCSENQESHLSSSIFSAGNYIPRRRGKGASIVVNRLKYCLQHPHPSGHQFQCWLIHFWSRSYDTGTYTKTHGCRKEKDSTVQQFVTMTQTSHGSEQEQSKLETNNNPSSNIILEDRMSARKPSLTQYWDLNHIYTGLTFYSLAPWWGNLTT